MFSSGHDMGSKVVDGGVRPGPNQHPTRTINGGTRKGAESRMLQEWHYFFENTRRWRNLRKITIAQVHGNVYAAGLMLMWACDLIVAADDVALRRRRRHPARACAASSTSPTRGSSGPARPRSSCSPATRIDVDEAHPLGHGVARCSRSTSSPTETLEFARRIAELPTMTALLIKESVNQTVDNMGFHNALERVLHAPPAQPLALGRGPRERVPGRPARGRHPDWRTPRRSCRRVKDKVRAEPA